MAKIIGDLMAVGADSSLIMAQRLRSLREEKGLSYDRLSKELSEKYQIKISSDSLMNYETKEYKNQGMRIEYLRCLADFYGVSADYLLGVASIKSSDITVQQIVGQTGLTEENVEYLIAWNDLLSLQNKSTKRALSNIEQNVLDFASKVGDSDFMRRAYIDLIQKLISGVSNDAAYICLIFGNIALEMESVVKYGKDYTSLSGAISEETFNELHKRGYTVLKTDDALALEWDQLTSALKKQIHQSIQHDIENRL